MKRIFYLLCALMLALCPACALAASSVIEPTEDFYVNDQANVLTEETEGLIVLNNDKLAEACGAQIVFVTLDTTGCSGSGGSARATKTTACWCCWPSGTTTTGSPTTWDCRTT